MRPLRHVHNPKPSRWSSNALGVKRKRSVGLVSRDELRKAGHHRAFLRRAHLHKFRLYCPFFQAARHMVKHKTFAGSGGSGDDAKDEAHERALEQYSAYEQRVKTLVAMTMDARAQLAEAFLQLGNATQCFVELTDPHVDVVSAGVAIGVPGAVMPPANNSLTVRATQSKVVAGSLQEAFHTSFGQALQTTLLSPLEGEIELFERTRAHIAKHHEKWLDHQHYTSKLTSLQTKGGDSDKDRERLHRNSDKAHEAANALNEAKGVLQADFEAHDAARVELLTRRVNELKGMLHRFCEAALNALAALPGANERPELELDRYNIYGDVKVESAMSKLRRGITSTTRSAGRSADSVALRLAHMQRHAATTFTVTKKEREAETDDPLELETNEMASRYAKAWSVLEKLPPMLAALQHWYASGLATFAGVAAELAAIIRETDSEDDKVIVLTFHATLDEVSASLKSNFVERVAAEVGQPLAASLDEFKELPERLRNRRVKALEREHYANKVATLEKRSGELALSDKASEAAKEKANERWERNKTKASEADMAARNETIACRERLIDFDAMFKSRVETIAASLDHLQREFYLDFAARVASKLHLKRQQTSPDDAASASKLQDLMARGFIVPQSGMTADAGAAFEFQRTLSASSEYLRTSSSVAPGDQSDNIGLVAAVRESSGNVSQADGRVPRPPPPPVPPGPGSGQPKPPPPAPQHSAAFGQPRPPPPAPMPAYINPNPAAPSSHSRSPAPSTAISGGPAIQELTGRKASLTPAEAEQVRAMMMYQAGTAQSAHSSNDAPPPAAPPVQKKKPPPPPKPAPPRPPPGMIFVKGLFDFDEVQAGDLGFKAGDVITTEQAAFEAAGASGAWINGELHGKSGVFPSNYVDRVL